MTVIKLSLGVWCAICWL